RSPATPAGCRYLRGPRPTRSSTTPRTSPSSCEPRRHRSTRGRRPCSCCCPSPRSTLPTRSARPAATPWPDAPDDGVGPAMSSRRLEIGRGERRHRSPATLITGRGLQVALGVFWLIAGLLQLQSYMYTHAFVAQVLEPAAAGQPSVIGDPIMTFARFYGRDLPLWNTLAAELQCAIGLGLIVTRRAVRPALA